MTSLSNTKLDLRSKVYLIARFLHRIVPCLTDFITRGTHLCEHAAPEAMETGTDTPSHRYSGR